MNGLPAGLARVFEEHRTRPHIIESCSCSENIFQSSTLIKTREVSAREVGWFKAVTSYDFTRGQGTSLFVPMGPEESEYVAKWIVPKAPFSENWSAFVAQTMRRKPAVNFIYIEGVPIESTDRIMSLFRERFPDEERLEPIKTFVGEILKTPPDVVTT